MENLNLKAKGIMAFVPSGENYENSIRFYQELGFNVDWKSEQLSVLRIDECRFFLQNFKNEVLQKNFVMNLDVDNPDDWWQKIEKLKLPEKYHGVKIKAPETYPWGRREIHLIDPAGVLWHIGVSV
jgi:hypothetical protein